MKKLLTGALTSLIILGGVFLFETATVGAAEGPQCEQGKFDADCLFPTWDSDATPGQATDVVVQGVIGRNQDAGFLMSYIPKIIDILLKFIAPVVVLMMIYSGIRFITAQGDDEQLSKAKDFFTYAIVGVGLIVLSYSIMKVVYFLVAKG